MLVNGTVLHQRYRVTRLLGLSGTGAVYRVWDVAGEYAATLKELIPQPGIAPSMLSRLREQLRREAEALMLFDHPHLARVLDFFEEGGNAYVVLTYVEGESLAERIARRGAMREAEVLSWAEPLLDALAYCHARNVVHRDVKPHNVLFDAEGRVVLVGFGMTKLWDRRDPRTWAAVRVMGTPAYAAPEQWGLQRGGVDVRSDIYALGATLYHALTGKAPLTAWDRMADPYRFLPVDSPGGGISERTRAVIAQAMALPRERRFQSVEEMRRALLEKPIPLPPRELRPASLMVRRRRIAWGWLLRTGMVTVAVLLLLTLVLVVGGRWRQQAHAPGLFSPSPTAAPSRFPPGSQVTLSPRPTLSPTPAPTHGISLSPTPGRWPVMLVDAFDDNTNDWVVTAYQDDWGRVRREIADGVYRWEIEAFRSVSRWCMPEVTPVADFRLAVEAQRVSGPEDVAYGLVFRHTAGSYYLFSVRENGYFRFSLWADFAWMPIVDWTETPLVRAGEVNRLEVVAKGTHFSLHINGQPVAEAEDDYLVSGEVGLSVALFTPGKAVVVFDNFDLRGR